LQNLRKQLSFALALYLHAPLSTTRAPNRQATYGSSPSVAEKRTFGVLSDPTVDEHQLEAGGARGPGQTSCPAALQVYQGYNRGSHLAVKEET